MDIIEITVNCPDAACAEAIATALLAERLAAAANVQAGLDSHYVWQGEPTRRAEVRLHLKTRAALFDACALRIAALHPYEVPCILGHFPAFCTRAYADWVTTATRPA